MLDSILIAMSGLSSHQKGLRTISDNVANMNTPGFKSTQAQFSDVFRAQAGDPSNESSDDALPGGGVSTQGAAIDFSAGDIRNTGRSLDSAIDGSGFFVLEDASGQRYFTKTGRFEFDSSGELVSSDHNYKVMGLAGPGSLVSLSNAALKVDAPSATAKVTLTGNLTTQNSSHTVNNIKVYDAQGAQHTLTMTLTRKSTVLTNSWLVTIKEGETTLLSGAQYDILDSGPDPTAAEVSMDLKSPDGRVSTIVFALGSDVTSFSGGSSSTLDVATVDGYGAGTAQAMSFDANGVLTVAFTNGQTRRGGRLAIAEFAQMEDLRAVSGALFSAADDATVQYTAAGIGSSVQSGALELSNVDLTAQFGDLVLVQRGYQASSQVLTTANEMIQQLLDMKGRR